MSDLMAAAQAAAELPTDRRFVVEWLEKHVPGDCFDGINSDDFPAWAREITAGVRQCVADELMAVADAAYERDALSQARWMSEAAVITLGGRRHGK